MSATGIGAAVRHKEDHRFITGQGRYTDDVNRPGQAHAYFLRSPHAHAKIKAIDTKAAAGMPGVLGIFTGADLATDKIGGLICGWMIHNKDGSPMRAGPHPALAQDKVRRRRRRDPGASARRGRGDRGRLSGIAGGGRHRQGDRRQDRGP